PPPPASLLPIDRHSRATPPRRRPTRQRLTAPSWAPHSRAFPLSVAERAGPSFPRAAPPLAASGKPTACVPGERGAATSRPPLRRVPGATTLPRALPATRYGTDSHTAGVSGTPPPRSMPDSHHRPRDGGRPGPRTASPATGPPDGR